MRHIIENVASYAEFADAVTGILKTFTKYQIPVIKSVSRQESYLFKFLLTHNFILSNARKHHVPAEGRRIYEAFEVEFQLDGQYWLQYGLYLVALGQLEPALHVLLRSIQAYPDNLFAVHAHADLQLRIAKQRSTYDSTTRNLIGEAVEALLKQDARRELVLDQYPIVTLANGHIGALVKHGRLAEAKKAAAQYFERLKELDRQISNQLVNRTKERLLRFVTLNQWAEHFLDAGQGRAKERKWK